MHSANGRPFLVSISVFSYKFAPPGDCEPITPAERKHHLPQNQRTYMTRNYLGYGLIIGLSLLWMGCSASSKNEEEANTASANTEEYAVPNHSVPPREEIVLERIMPTEEQAEKGIAYEDEYRRIEEKEIPGDEMASIFTIIPKQKDIKAFKTRPSIEYENQFGLSVLEAVLDQYLIVSNGTGTVRDLVIYDLNTGKEVMIVPNVPDQQFILDAKDRNGGFYFYRIMEENISVSYDEKSRTWKENQPIPQELKASLEQALKKPSNYISLVAHQKIFVDLRNSRETILPEYTWQYAE